MSPFPASRIQVVHAQHETMSLDLAGKGRAYQFQHLLRMHRVRVRCCLRVFAGPGRVFAGRRGRTVRHILYYATCSSILREEDARHSPKYSQCTSFDRQTRVHCQLRQRCVAGSSSEAEHSRFCKRCSLNYTS